MSNPWAYVTLRPAFVGEDYYDTVTVDGSGSISGWALVADLLDAAGDSVATPTATVLDADARTVRVAITGLDLGAGDYRLTLYRTDALSRTLVLWGTLEVVDPAGQLAWGAGF